MSVKTRISYKYVLNSMIAFTDHSSSIQLYLSNNLKSELLVASSINTLNVFIKRMTTINKAWSQLCMRFIH